MRNSSALGAEDMQNAKRELPSHRQHALDVPAEIVQTYICGEPRS
jgi:hypothetical protein